MEISLEKTRAKGGLDEARTDFAENMTEEPEHNRCEQRWSQAFIRIQRGIETWLLVWLVKMDMRMILSLLIE